MNRPKSSKGKANGHPVDVSGVTGTDIPNDPDRKRLVGMPYDLPLVMHVLRHMGDFPETRGVPGAKGLKGWTVRLDAFGFGGTQIEIKIARHPKHVLTIWLDGEEIGRVTGGLPTRKGG